MLDTWADPAEVGIRFANAKAAEANAKKMLGVSFPIGLCGLYMHVYIWFTYVHPTYSYL